MVDVPCSARGFDIFGDPQIDCLCKKILDLTHVGIIIVDRAGIIKHMNHTYAEMFNLDRGRFIGQKITEIFPDAPLLRTLERRVVEKGVKFSFRGQDALLSRYPITNDDGEVIGGLAEVYFRDISELSALLRKVDRLEEKVRYYQRKSQGLPCSRYEVDDIVGNSEAIRRLKVKIRAFARTRQPILIQGESGSGKELVAHAIHSASLRSQEIFVAVNCAAIPKELLGAELFGYEPGTFTGASRGGKVGKFELADRGTIFLDEIGEFPLPMQAALLRVLENKEIQKLGRATPVYSDFRLVAATNKDLEAEVAAGRFRADLYHRLSALVLKVPPLRQRPEDIELLVAHFLETIDEVPHPRDLRVEPKVMQLLAAYEWPGNVRELRNVLSFAILSLEEGEKAIRFRHLPPYIIDRGVSISTGSWDKGKTRVPSLKQAREKMESGAIAKALEAAQYNKTKAAKMLGISRNELYKKMRKYGIESAASRPPRLGNDSSR